jgi:hypothetical protein
MKLNSQTGSASSGGIGFFGLLTIVFIILKLIGKIDWSWFWVLSPLIISIGLGIVLFVAWLALTVWVDRS